MSAKEWLKLVVGTSVRTTVSTASGSGVFPEFSHPVKRHAIIEVTIKNSGTIGFYSVTVRP